jgi:hypothetical protein
MALNVRRGTWQGVRGRGFGGQTWLGIPTPRGRCASVIQIPKFAGELRNLKRTRFNKLAARLSLKFASEFQERDTRMRARIEIFARDD